MKFPRIFTLLSGKVPDEGAQFAVANEDRAAMETLDIKVTGMEAFNATLISENSQLKSDITAKNTKITSLEATIAKLNDQVTQLSKEKVDQNKYQTSVDTQAEKLRSARGFNTSTSGLTSVDKEAEKLRRNRVLQ